MIAAALAPFKAKAVILALGVAAVAAGGLYTWGLYWRGEARAMQAQNVALAAQGKVLAQAVNACSASVDALSTRGQEATAAVAAMLAEARRLSSGGRAVVTETERLIAEARGLIAAGKPPARPDGTPKDCGDAWREIEKIEKNKALARGAR